MLTLNALQHLKGAYYVIVQRIIKNVFFCAIDSMNIKIYKLDQCLRNMLQKLSSVFVQSKTLNWC
jgi:hypothetical protein